MRGSVDVHDLNDLYDASYRRLVVQVYAICGDLAVAEDAVQDAFVTALRKRSQLARVSNPEAWVRTVALNAVRHGWRHASVVRPSRTTWPTSPWPRSRTSSAFRRAP